MSETGEWDDLVDVTGLEEAAPVNDRPQTVYLNVADFFHEHLRHLYARHVGSGTGQHRWSARWWESAEAISRLESVWRAWEHLRLEPALGMSTWWRDHADYHMGILLSPGGPFRTSKDENMRGEPLPSKQPPVGLFPVEESSS